MGRRLHEPESSLHGDIDMSHWEPYKYRELGRDSQQVREYRSEWDFRKALPEELMSNETMLGFLRTVAADDWFTDRFGVVKFGVTFSRRRKSRAVCNYNITRGFTLKFPGNSCMNYRIIALHELMHVVCHQQSHGPIYCSALLQVVIHYMGLVAGRELRHQFTIKMVELVR